MTRSTSDLHAHLNSSARFRHLRRIARAAGDHIGLAHIGYLESEMKRLRQEWMRYFWQHGELPPAPTGIEPKIDERRSK